MDDELIPRSYLYKKNDKTSGELLSKFLKEKVVRYKRSYEKNNVSAANILEKTKIDEKNETQDYKLAVARVGNGSVGKAGLINIKKDILNDMFYVFDFRDRFNDDALLKEKLCELINKRRGHFCNITFRVGSKSIKKSDVLGFRVEMN
ncbi:hypothetical protein COV61_03245 [Candidatus Micrarchaeota archaeon CG11_big_fil_rev_8_21_14_0_20_47_5]|nr:MAG: hypothetical protein COV61_03245 [Candidatus Micrarchaeota archaeon CG11_big_fil_rev_8_21_14_0_20_47_5]